MRVGLGLGSESLEEIGSIAKLADELGYDHLTFVNAPLTRAENTVTMTIAATQTSRIRLGQGVSEPMSYHPAVIGATAATLRQFTGGRAFIGLGTGQGAGNHFLRGATPKELRECLRFLRDFTAGKEATLDGHTGHSQWVRGSEWDGQPIPIVVACSGPRVCAAAGELADAALVVGSSPAMVRTRMRWIREAAERAGRNPDEVEIWVRTQIYVTDDPESLRSEVSPYAADQACNFYRSTCNVDTPHTLEMREVVEDSHPGLLDTMGTINAMDGPYVWARGGSTVTDVVTQDVIDSFLLVGSSDSIVQRIGELEDLGVTAVSSVLYGLQDRKQIITDAANSVLPRC